MNFDINFLAVIIAAAASMVIGSVWYSQKLFGNYWMKNIGKDPKNPADMDDLKKKAPKAMGVSALMSVLTAYVMAQFLAGFGVASLSEGIQLAFWAWLGFTAAVLLTHSIYEQKKFGYFLVQAVFQLVVFVAMAIILTAWM